MAQTLKQQIRRVIKQHYGEDLATFREDVNYQQGTEAFVTDVTRAIRGELRFSLDLPNEMAKYIKPGGVDRSVGETIRNLRVKKEITQEQLAAMIGFDVGFLVALEDGHIAATIDVYIDTYDALKPTKKEREEFAHSISLYKTPESIVRDVIEIYYGMNLWMFHPGVSYEDAIGPFIRSLTTLAKS
jgi:transcriptional regulator with XRE-family HTH domain